MTDFGLETIRLKISKGDNLISPLVGSDTMINLGLGLLSSTVLYGRGGFSPASLFSAGEQGAWYDPSDLTTMFQNSAGTTPVTAVEQPVGLLLDKSKGLALGAEIISVAADRDFSSDTGFWTKTIGVTISGGQCVYTSVSSLGGIYRTGLLTAGIYYEITFTISSITAGAIRLYVGGNSTGNITTAGTYTERIVAGSVDAYLIFENFGTTTLTLDNVSIKPVTGNHASQSTSASRPVLSARVNQLLATATLSTQNVTTLAATYTLAFSGAGTVTATGTNIGVYSAGSNSLVCTAGTLTLTVVGSVTLADLRVTNVGVGLPAYQAVVTSTNYDTNGFPLYLKFDGTDDSLATASIDFSATDKMSVFAGVRKLSDTAAGVIAELSNDAGANNGAFNILASTSIGDGARRTWGGQLRGTANNSFGGPTYASPISGVITQKLDIAGAAAANEIIQLVNGSATTLTFLSADSGTGNFGNYPLYVGRRNNASVPYNGNLYSLIVRGALSTDAQIASTETYVNNLTKAY